MIFVAEVFATVGEAESGCGIEVEIEGGAPPCVAGGVVFYESFGLVDCAVEAQAEHAADLGGGNEIVLMYLVIARVAAADVVEVELQVVVGSEAVLSDEVLLVRIGGGDGAPVGGIGNTDHDTGFAQRDIGFGASMGEWTVGEHVGHAIVAVGIGVYHFVADVSGPGAAGEL